MPGELVRVPQRQVARAQRLADERLQGVEHILQVLAVEDGAGLRGEDHRAQEDHGQDRQHQRRQPRTACKRVFHTSCPSH